MPSYPYYPQYYQQPNYQIPQNIQPSAPQQIQQPQIQNGGFVSVRSESEARNYPVAIGNSVTFKDETEPYVYTKTMGFSQLDRPIFEKYKLVKEEVEDESSVPERKDKEIDSIKSDVLKLWGEVNELKEISRKKNQPQQPKPSRNGEH